MVSAKGFSRGEWGEEEEAWKVGTKTNETGRQLNPVLPSKGCKFFFARTGRRGQRMYRKDFKSTFRHLICCPFLCFLSSHLWFTSLCPPISLRRETRGSEREGKERGKAYKSGEFFTTIGFALVLSFAVY